MMKVIQPLVSFIIPCYNLPSYMVIECITSILNLSLNPDEREIIVIDDGSEKLLINEIHSFANSINYIRQNNKGLSESRNIGINVSKGRYIQFVDGDDKLINEGYEYCLDIVRNYNPDMVIFDFANNENKRNNTFEMPECECGSDVMLKKNLRAAAWRYVFNRNILHDLRFTAGIYHEDEEFTPLLMLNAERIFNTKTIAYYYRKRPDSIMNTIDENIVSKRMDDMEYVIYSLQDKSNSMPLMKKKALERRIAQITVAYIYQIIKLTHSSKYLEERLKRLEQRNLFPLPDNKYNMKYSLFRILAGKKILRNLLLLMIR